MDQPQKKKESQLVFVSDEKMEQEKQGLLMLACIWLLNGFTRYLIIRFVFLSFGLVGTVDARPEKSTG